MFITGISDEAGKPMAKQIRAHKELGWTKMEIRDLSVADGPAANLHDISDSDFNKAERMIRDAGMEVYCFSSRIANWQKKIDEPFTPSREEALRSIRRMKALGTQYIRIMSFAIRPDTDDQMSDERFHRLRELVSMFQDAGLTPLHENCMNYGGMGWPYTLELIEQVPGLKLIFDTGNPVFADDRSKHTPWPKQSAWEFYDHIRDHVAYVHIKDAVWDDKTSRPVYCFPGDGDGDVLRIVTDLHANGFTGGLSIEPHMGAVYHDPSSACPEDLQYSTYVEYGRRLERLLELAKTNSAEPSVSSAV